MNAVVSIRPDARPAIVSLALWLAAIFWCSPAGSAAETNAPPPAPVTVAVFDFDARDELGRDFGKEVSTLLTAHLSGNPALWTVERAELDRLLAEQALGLSGLTDPATAARVGQMTGVKVLVTGRAFRAGNELLLVAKIIGTETSRVYGEVAKAAKDAPVTRPAEELAGKIAATVAAKADTLIAKVVTRADRVSALKAALKTDKRPSVSVKIPEVHFGTPAVDPAAQTELALLFKEVGCELADEQSAKPADLEISGEAFSEVGLRRAGLVSCKARVEIKVRDRLNGKVLLAERQMSVAVDVSEQIAAKRALQEAAAELAERVIPELAK